MFTSVRSLGMWALVVASAALLAVRLFAASRIGFGDSEALYAAYALHPQPAYLDHPGLVGALARIIGGGTAPGPERVHVVTGLLATLVPWTMALACRACGATWPRSFVGALVFALVPEVAIGLFALTPDLLLALTWTGAIGLGAYALRSAAGSARAASGFASAGLLAGVAAASKVTGVTLMVGLAVTYASRAARPHARTVAPWAGLGAGALVVWPIVAFEARNGWPMLHHRLVATQATAGVSLRNVAALVGGQLAYLSPFTTALAVLAARPLWRGRRDATGQLLLSCCLVPFGALLPFCVWSRVAEPHWLAPALLALIPAATMVRSQTTGWPPRWLLVCSLVGAGAMVIAAHAWVLVPALLRRAPESYDPRLDLANELYGWPDVVRAVREEARQVAPSRDHRRDPIAVVGPHWVICAQLEAALGRELAVGCNTPIRDDFDDWWPRDQWSRADVILWVTDARFGSPPEMPLYATLRTRHVAIERAGRTVRDFTIVLLARHVNARN
jgi:hypothetical protein